MIDMHCHILPGIDDGSASMDDSIAMAAAAAADGITHIVATPHISQGNPDITRIQRLSAQLQSRLKDRGIDIELLSAGEVDAFDDINATTPYCINGGRYILLEFHQQIVPMVAREIIFQYRVNGLVPVMAHAERNGAIINSPTLAHELMEAGCLMQVTADSILGNFGPAIKDSALDLLHKGCVHVVASDAHSPVWRPPGLSAAFKECVRIMGQQEAEALFVHNPMSIIKGETLGEGR